MLYGHEGQANSAEFDGSGSRLVTTGTTVRSASASTAGEPLAVVHRHQDIAERRFMLMQTGAGSEGAEGVVLSYTCEVCLLFDNALGVAQSRLQRKLSAADRQRLLSDAD